MNADGKGRSSMQESTPGSRSYQESHRSSENSSHNETLTEDSGSDSTYTDSEEGYQADEERQGEYIRDATRSNAFDPMIRRGEPQLLHSDERQQSYTSVNDLSSFSGDIANLNSQPSFLRIPRSTPNTYWGGQTSQTSQQVYGVIQPSHEQTQQYHYGRMQRQYADDTQYNKSILGRWSQSSMKDCTVNTYYPDQKRFDMQSNHNTAEKQNLGGHTSPRGYELGHDKLLESTIQSGNNQNASISKNSGSGTNLTRHNGDELTDGSTKHSSRRTFPQRVTAPMLAPLITQKPSTSVSSLQQRDVLEQFPSLNGIINISPGGPGQQVPPQLAHTSSHVSTALWEEEGTLCLVVELSGMAVTRRCDNNMINGTKLLNSAKITRGRRDGVLKGERVRHVVKIGGMDFKGVWIPFERALDMAQREKVLDALFPLFVADLTPILYSPQNYSRLRQLLAKGSRRNPSFNDWIHGIPHMHHVTISNGQGEMSEQQRDFIQRYNYDHDEISKHLSSASTSSYEYKNNKLLHEQPHPRTMRYRSGNTSYSSMDYSNIAHNEGNINPDRALNHRKNWERQRQIRGVPQDNIPYSFPPHFANKSETSETFSARAQNAALKEDTPITKKEE